MKKLGAWLEDRTGLSRGWRALWGERLPGGARWGYVWGAALVFGLVVQMLTGLALWLAYSPSTHTAWESVFYIQQKMWGGWLVRGIHYYTGEAMVVLLVVHFTRVLITGAYRAPREVTFWLGLGLAFLVVAEALTGYMLPWDQRGHQAVRVDSSMVALTPVVGPQLQQLIMGGAVPGHHTLTRLFAMHAGLLPGAIILLVAGHLFLVRRQGRAVGQPRGQPEGAFWPDQVWRDGVACLAVSAAVMFLVLRMHGAHLGAPADPAEPYGAARPAWYLMFLFQFLKLFPGPAELWGAIVIPGVVLLLVVAMPFLGIRRWGHRFNLGYAGGLALGLAVLTWLAYAADRSDAEYQRARQTAARDAARARVLAESPGGIPVAGAATLMRQDPLTQGPRLFARHCASCHRYDGHDGTGRIPPDAQSAADLKGFAGVGWLSGLLDPQRIGSPGYFGGTRFVDGKMARFVKTDVAKFNPEQKAQLARVILALSAEAGLKGQPEVDQVDPVALAEGRKGIKSDDMRCTECHDFHGANDDPIAPTLTGYGSRDWLAGLIHNPAQDQYYGQRNDRMPAFGEKQILTQESLGLLTDWLRGEWYTKGSKTNVGHSLD